MDDFKERAADVAVFSGVDRIWGIPRTYLAVTIIVGLPFVLMVSVWIGLTLVAFSLYGLYQAHREDPQMADVMIDRVRSQVNAWRAGTKKARPIIRIK